MNLQYDGQLDIATGKHRRTKTWRNKQVNWAALVTKLSETHRTAESYKEYLSFKKDMQDERKDIGGFVGGVLASGRRKKGNVVHRQLITLDADFANRDFWDGFTLVFDCAAVLYSTHKHCPEKPRYRLIIPLDREVMADEYQAISRRVADMVGVDQFDPTTYAPERLMYWPSTSSDGEYVFEFQDGPWLSADSILKTYQNWRDSSQWPMGAAEREAPVRDMKKQGDPLEKPGLVGAFCRTYTVQEAIEKFLGDAYEPTTEENRYSYKHGSTAGGLVIYDDKFAYSHHGTDPISGQLCNAFDLVRAHLFGLQDEDIAETMPANKRPSYLAMCELATGDTAVKVLINTEKMLAVREDFADFERVVDVGEDSAELQDEIDMSWTEKMDTDKKGNNLNTINNLILILENDPRYKGKIGYDVFAKQLSFKVQSGLWREIRPLTRLLEDGDVHQIEYHVETQYGIPPGNRLKKAFSVYGHRNGYHPIKDYLQSITWDGRPRLDQMLIDYLGAEDCEYVRVVTRKTLVAAVARIYEPGCKFDYMLTLIGPQGKNKSSLWDKLGGEWFSDSLTIKMLENGKEGMEKLRGVWIVEVPELTGMSKADVNSVKSFLTSRVDRYRVPYQELPQNFPRHCILVGTTNNWVFLRDPTGNRRFWPVDIAHGKPTKKVFKDLTNEERDQIWAEAVHYYQQGETLYLSPGLEVLAITAQTDHTEKDERIGIICDYLDTPLPENWQSLGLVDRRIYLNSREKEGADSDDFTAIKEGDIKREEVTAAEIWTELFEGKPRDMNTYNTKFIHEIMANMPGWDRIKSKRNTGIYGRQTVYKRIENG